MKSYKTTQFRANLANVFNDVQADGKILLQGQGRPEMILIMREQHDTLINKVNLLDELVEEFDLAEIIEIKLAIRNK